MSNELKVKDSLVEQEASTDVELLELGDILGDIQKTNGKKTNMINKRIDFDQKTLRRLETMLPLYKEEVQNANTSEMYSYVVRKAINSLFEGDFKQKLQNL